jgi:hypothetical protein
VTLLLGLIEDLAERVQRQDEEIAHLKDEVRVLKGQKKRPHFKPSKMDEQTDKDRSEGEAAEEDPRRPGSISSATARSISPRSSRKSRF